MPANLENSAVATGLEKVSFHSNPKEGQSSNYHTIALISRASKVMLKILQARLQQYINWQVSDVQAGFRKDRGTRDQIANIHWIMEKAREFQKNMYFCFIDYAKAFDCVDHNAAAKSLQLCPTLSDPMACSLPGSSIHGSFQARVLEWGAIAFSNVPITKFQTLKRCKI